MAKKARKSQARAKAAPPTSGAGGQSPKDRAIDALMALLAENPIEEIGLAEIAGRAGLSLSQLRAEFGSPLAILAAHIKETDRKVLDAGTVEEGTARERLFEVLMRRLEILAPHTAAVRSLLCSARRSPGLALAMNAMAVRSQHWMLTAAGINATGPRGAMRAQGAALLFARVAAVWIDDDESGLDRTMAALDRGLASAERWSGFLDDLFCVPAVLRRGMRGRRARNFDSDAEAA
jgi:AcrR family transcriptional regulator